LVDNKESLFTSQKRHWYFSELIKIKNIIPDDGVVTTGKIVEK
jgi:hypothetical protein